VVGLEVYYEFILHAFEPIACKKDIKLYRLQTIALKLAMHFFVIIYVHNSFIMSL